jgi:L-malate glycosyltransferase
MMASIAMILRICIHRRISLVYGNGSRAAFYGGIAAFIIRIPLVWHCRIAARDPYLDGIISALSSRIVANSHATASRFPGRVRSKVTVVHNGIDLRWFTEKVKISPSFHCDPAWKLLLVVARISRSKRHDVVVSAFELAAGDDPDVHLICIGAKDDADPEWWSWLQERTKHSPFADRIHWLGDMDDVRPWYQRATALVLASENEAFGRVLVEAMASGLPVIATRDGGVPEVVGHDRDGLLVPVGDILELAVAVKKILSDEPLRRRLSQSARERANTFSLDFHVSSMNYVFETVIPEQPSLRLRKR